MKHETMKHETKSQETKNQDSKSQETKKSKMVRNIVAIILCVALSACILTACPGGIGDIDDIKSIDLTTMSSTMVYTYVYDMLYTRPNAYIGKTVKAKGQHSVSYYDKTDKYYHYVIINDAAACCAQGIEFEYESDYPEENKEIEIIGIFEKYDELGTTYYYLKVSEIKVI